MIENSLSESSKKDYDALINEGKIFVGLSPQFSKYRVAFYSLQEKRMRFIDYINVKDLTEIMLSSLLESAAIWFIRELGLTDEQRDLIPCIQLKQQLENI